jgi:hypothetical protein
VRSQATTNTGGGGGDAAVIADLSPLGGSAAGLADRLEASPHWQRVHDSGRARVYVRLEARTGPDAGPTVQPARQLPAP